MTDVQKLEALRVLFREGIEFCQENADDPDYIYDELYNHCDLSRGDWTRVMNILMMEDDD